KHPDAPGFVIDQREARASFDDWRFMKYDLTRKLNLASIRSHDADAFFFSPFQAFLYFPDDPQFLTSQYEATVEAMVRMKCSLDYYNTISEEESLKIRENIEMHEDSARGEMSLCAKLSRWIENTHRKQLESKLKIIRQLKGETTETYNLITKA